MKTILFFETQIGDSTYTIKTEENKELNTYRTIMEQNMLFNGFGCKQKLQSAFFELFRVGDGKYTLTVQKYVNDTWSVKFKHNENFSNKAERFTK